MTIITRTSHNSSRTSPLNLRRNFNILRPAPEAIFFQNIKFRHRAQYFYKTSTFLLTSPPQLLQYIYTTNFPAEKYYEHTSLDLLIKQINEHVKNEEYVIIRKRNKSTKLRIFMKVVFRCDHGGK